MMRKTRPSIRSSFSHSHVLENMRMMVPTNFIIIYTTYATPTFRLSGMWALFSTDYKLTTMD